MLLKKRLDHKVPFPEPMRKSHDFRPLFASITILLLLGVIGILDHVQQVSLTGSAVQTIGFVKAGSDVEFEINTNGIKSATIHLTEDTKNARIFFTNTETVSQKPEGTIYSMTSVSSEKQLHFSKIILTLRIKEVELLNKDIAVSDVQLYINGNPIKTTYTQKEGDYVFYSATTSELGEYVIGKRRIEKAKPIVEKTKELPPQEQPTATKTVEEKTVEESNGLVGKAQQLPREQTTPVVKESFWQKIKNLFS